MDNIFSYEFMVISLIAILSVSIMLSLIGKTVVLKNISLIGDALAHTSLLGVAAGLVIGINPIIGAIVVCLLATVGIEFIRKKFKRYADLSLALILAFGLAMALIVSKYYNGKQSFESFLFGSLLFLSWKDIYWLVPISLLMSLMCILLYKELYLVSLNETIAKMSGVRVNLVRTAFILILAISVGASIKAAGALLVSALMTIPVANALILSKGYFKITIISVISAIIYSVLGWLLSYYISKAPLSAMVVVVGVVSCIITYIFKIVFKKIKKNKQQKEAKNEKNNK